MIPAHILAALGRLNAHARGRGGPFATERNAIYAYKTLAAIMLVEAGAAALRFVRCDVKCTCDDGWYWYDVDAKAPCRWCGGTGRRRLHFTETMLPDGQVWHHPWEGQTTPGYDIARAAEPVRADAADGSLADRVTWLEPGDWHPMMPPSPLPLPELVALLNRVEDWVERLPERSRGAPFWYHVESARHCLTQIKHSFVTGPHSHGYRLDLGRAPGGCFACGREGEHLIGRMTLLFHWSQPACTAHRKPWPTDPPPDSLMFPALREWRARHERVLEVA